MRKKNFIIYSLLTCVFSRTIMPVLAQEEVVSPVAPDARSDIEVISRNNGNFEQGAFFAGKDASYEIQFPQLRKTGVESVIVKIGKNEQKVDVSKGVANFPIEPGQEGYMEILYDDADGAEEVLPDYIVAEEIPPIVSCATLEGAEEEEMVVSIRDDGEIVSGIQSYKVLLDGEELKDYTEVKTEAKLSNGASIYNKVEISIPAEKKNAGKLSVIVKDQCGNVTEKSISLEEGENEDIQKRETKAESLPDIPQEATDDILVIVPTDIELKFFTGPNMVDGNIQSQDIMLINKSEFPVRVKVSQAQYEVKKGDKRIPCELSAVARQYKKEEQTWDLGKKGSVPFYLELAAGREETDAQALLEDAAKWNPTGAVTSPDYGILRLEGTATQSGKTSVDMVFEFEKVKDGQ